MSAPTLARRFDDEREHRMFWVQLDGEVHHSEGLDCRPNDYWWFPDLGFSIPESRCYSEPIEAYMAAEQHLMREIGILQRRLEDVRRHLP